MVAKGFSHATKICDRSHDVCLVGSFQLQEMVIASKDAFVDPPSQEEIYIDQPDAFVHSRKGE